MKEALIWLLQRISGLVLLVALFIHLYLMHYSGYAEGYDPVSYETIQKRLSDPYWISFDVVFLIFAIFHGFSGIHGIAIEYVRSARLQKILQPLIVVTAFMLFFAGVYIITA